MRYPQNIFFPHIPQMANNANALPQNGNLTGCISQAITVRMAKIAIVAIILQTVSIFISVAP